ncbi:hypothetical protein LCGC14_1238570 [marine sediment metagenome]|uniref:Uncharacterized protein n=1 Tax=marine sediment metagenome TaxID=412755 RepID=A0A0F9L6P2_9ZZZZ
MSENLPDIEEARLHLASVSGRHTGVKYAERLLDERAGKAFMARRDSDAKVLRLQAGMLHQEAELIAVEQSKALKNLYRLEKKGKQ